MKKIFKNIFFWILILLLIIFILHLINKNQQEKPKIASNHHSIQIDSMNLIGYDKQKIIWHIVAKTIWAGRSKYLFWTDRVINGDIFDNNQNKIVTNIKGGKLKANTKNKTLFVEDKISAQLIRRIKTKNKTQSIKIFANRMSYIQRKAIFKGEVKIIKGKYSIDADIIELNTDKNIVSIKDNFQIKSNSLTTTAKEMIIDLDKDYAILRGKVKIIKKPDSNLDSDLDERELALRKQKTIITCNSMRYELDQDNEKIQVSGNVRVLQGHKIIRADFATYEEEKEEYQLIGNIYIKALNLKWLLKKSQIASFTNKDLKKALFESMRLYSDRIIFNAKNKTIRVIGRNKFKQDKTIIECKEITYNDFLETIILKGDVLVKRINFDVLECDSLSFNLKNQEFIAQNVKRTKIEF